MPAVDDAQSTRSVWQVQSVLASLDTMLRTARFFRLPLAPIKAALFSAARRSPAAAAFRAADPTAKCLSTKAAATTIVQRPDAPNGRRGLFELKLPFVNRHDSLKEAVENLADKSKRPKGMLFTLPQMFGSGKTSFVEHIGNERNPHAKEILDSAPAIKRPLYESVLNARYILIDMTHFNRMSDMADDVLEAIFLNTCSTLGLPPLAVPRGPLGRVISGLQKHAGVPLLLHFDEMGAIENSGFDPWFPGSEYRCSSQPNVFAPNTGALRRHYTFWSRLLAPLLNLDNVYIVCSGKSVAFSLIQHGLLRAPSDAPVGSSTADPHIPMTSPSELQTIILPPLGGEHIEEILNRHRPDVSSPELIDTLGLRDKHAQRLAFTECVHTLTAGVPRLVSYALQVPWGSGIDFGAMTPDEIRAYFALGTTQASIASVFLMNSLELTAVISRPHDPLYLASANIVRRALAGEVFDPKSTIEVRVPGKPDPVQVQVLLLLDRLFCYTKPVDSSRGPQVQVILPQIVGTRKELALATLIIELAGTVVTSETLEVLALWSIFAALYRATIGDPSSSWLLAQSKGVLPQAVLDSDVVQHILQTSAPHQGIGFDERTLSKRAGSITVSVAHATSAKRHGIDAAALPDQLVARLVELRTTIPTGPIAVVEWIGKASQSSDGMIAVCTAASPTVQNTVWIGVACKLFNRNKMSFTGPTIVNEDIERLSRHFAHLEKNLRPRQLLISVLSRPPNYLKPSMNSKLLEGRVTMSGAKNKKKKEVKKKEVKKKKEEVVDEEELEVIDIPPRMQVALWDLDTLNNVVDPSRKLTFPDQT
ncbi:hypothetical protein CAOG_08956 [Capsaspora owczarzaki ATCC 30864]|uniref:Uncharacterized protein n=1 Tax=Capsaspora owczarzaki (strain ATCC 30864) TaxID=595528 RepID=A0A0D2VW83_CAPO3|nr:hypothetical protein CAOG_08956 [Capsaspora owczarzaki ATCC 30864]KJE95792.1 hypothetical protein CAOG_008956 [Capsaspora owczarzaki ATCC 30864]|eukprot:XP_011270627.1 hypothetical protein CAOG_08956 [Capsaspora owczarzaki ATCC 30864]